MALPNQNLRVFKDFEDTDSFRDDLLASNLSTSTSPLSQVAADLPKPSSAYQYATAEGGIGLDAYYNNINKFLANNPDQQAITDAMSEWGVSQEDVDAAKALTVKPVSGLSSIVGGKNTVLDNTASVGDIGTSGALTQATTGSTTGSTTGLTTGASDLTSDLSTNVTAGGLNQFNNLADQNVANTSGALTQAGLTSGNTTSTGTSTSTSTGTSNSTDNLGYLQSKTVAGGRGKPTEVFTVPGYGDVSSWDLSGWEPWRLEMWGLAKDSNGNVRYKGAPAWETATGAPKNLFDQISGVASLPGMENAYAGGAQGREEGGFGSKQAMLWDIAQKLAAQGITSLTDIKSRTVKDSVGAGEGSDGYEIDRTEYYNAKTGEPINLQGTGVGNHQTEYHLTNVGNGLIVPYTVGTKSDWVNFRNDVLPIAMTFVSLAYPAAAPYIQAFNAAKAASNGQWMQAALSGLSAASGLSANVSANIDALANAGKFDEALDLYNNSWLAQNASTLKTASTAVGGLNALQNKDAVGLINAGVNLAGATIPAEVRTGVNWVNFGTAVANNDLAGMLNGAGVLTKSSDLQLAGTATKFITAMNRFNQTNNPNDLNEAISAGKILNNYITNYSSASNTNKTTTGSSTTGTTTVGDFEDTEVTRLKGLGWTNAQIQNYFDRLDSLTASLDTTDTGLTNTDTSNTRGLTGTGGLTTSSTTDDFENLMITSLRNQGLNNTQISEYLDNLNSASSGLNDVGLFAFRQAKVAGATDAEALRAANLASGKTSVTESETETEAELTVTDTNTETETETEFETNIYSFYDTQSETGTELIVTSGRETLSETQSETLTEVIVTTASETVSETESETITEFIVTTASETESESETMTEIIVTTASETQSESETMTEIVVTTASETISETESETLTEIIVTTASETISETESETLTEIIVTTASETVSETESETLTEIIVTTASETVSETETETETETLTEIIVTTSSETKTETETETETITEIIVTTSSETQTETETETITKIVTTPVVTKPPTTSSSFTAGTPTVGGKGKPHEFMKEQLLKTYMTKDSFKDPLAQFNKARQELAKDEMMQQGVDPRLAAILAAKMNGEEPPPAPAYNYGEEPQSIDDILGLKTEGEQNFAQGGYVQPLMARGGMALPLLAAKGGLPSMHKGREDFRHGKHVAGEGDGQSDDIPAMLADGEFVFPADVVSALGNGSTKAGTDKLYEMMHSIRDRARSKGPKDLPPPAFKSPLDYLKKR